MDIDPPLVEDDVVEIAGRQILSPGNREPQGFLVEDPDPIDDAGVSIFGLRFIPRLGHITDLNEAGTHPHRDAVNDPADGLGKSVAEVRALDERLSEVAFRTSPNELAPILQPPFHQ